MQNAERRKSSTSRGMASGSLSSTAQRANELLRSGLYSDLTVLVDYGGEKHAIRVHRCILILASDVWASAVKWEQTETLVVTQYPFPIIRDVISFAYTAAIKFHDVQHCLTVLSAAHYYDMTALVNSCGDYIKSSFLENRINAKEFVELFNLVTLYNITAIQFLCVAYLEDKSLFIMESDEFLEFTHASLLELLKRKRHICPDYVMAKSLLRWTENACKKTDCGDLKDFLRSNRELLHFGMLDLSETDLSALLNDYPTLKGENYQVSQFILNDLFGDDMLNRCNAQNENSSDRIIVRSPPMRISEEFVYNGPSGIFPVYALELEPRFNSVDPQVSSSFEEKFTISLGNVAARFEGVVAKNSGTFVKFPAPAQLSLREGASFTVDILLHKCGYYLKNYTFSLLSDTLVRKSPGIIMAINGSHDKSSSSGSIAQTLNPEYTP